MNPFEGMTPAQIYRSGYEAGRAGAMEACWDDFVANIEADSRRIIHLALERTWEGAKRG